MPIKQAWIQAMRGGATKMLLVQTTRLRSLNTLPPQRRLRLPGSSRIGLDSTRSLTIHDRRPEWTSAADDGARAALRRSMAFDWSISNA